MLQNDRASIAKCISEKLKTNETHLIQQYNDSSGTIGYFFIDDLLPPELVTEINNHFPDHKEMQLKKSLKEYKFVAAQMNRHHPLLEEVIYAFQEDHVVDCIKTITGITDLYPDSNLYAGGISSMGKDQFLNPHLDNSHDKDRNRWRVLNLLYYVSPNWENNNGGHLELWPNGLENAPVTIHSKSNRLVVMATHQKSWHSVNKVTVDRSRNCVSNYYFSDAALTPIDRFHVTTFRGRPGQYLVNQILKIDSVLRMCVRKLFKKGIVKNPHVYKKDNPKT